MAAQLNEALSAAGATSAVNVGDNGVVVATATANTGTQIFLQVNVAGTWADLTGFIPTSNDPKIETLPAGAAVRIRAAGAVTAARIVT